MVLLLVIRITEKNIMISVFFWCLCANVLLAIEIQSPHSKRRKTRKKTLNAFRICLNL